MALLQPIFDSIRAGENASLCSFPMSSINVNFNSVNSFKRRVNVPKISLSHCHSVRVEACQSQKLMKKFPLQSTRDYSHKSRAGSTADSDQSDSVSFGRRTPSRTLLTPRTSIPIRSSLTPGTSRPTSRPASRHGSSVSLASTDEATPTRIPTRKAASTSSTPNTCPLGRMTPTQAAAARRMSAK